MNELRIQLNHAAAEGFNLAVDCTLPGEGVTALYGPSGSGKTTLLDCVAGLRTARGATITLGEHRWQEREQVRPAWRRGIGYVFQDARLFPHLSIRDNLLYGATRQAGPAAIKFDEAVDWLQLQELLERQPDTLSAGQRQRAAIGRALLAAQSLVLLDEPLANLDFQATAQCLRGLKNVAEQHRLPMLYVSHDIEEVSQLADHIALLENGRLTDQGSLIDMCSRIDSRLAQEEQAAAIVSATVARHDKAYGLSELHVAGQTLWVNQLSEDIGCARRVRIPARDVSVCRTRPTDTSILNVFRVTIAEVEESGAARLLLRLALGDQFLLARITRKSATELGFAAGEEVFAQVKSAALLMEAQ
ncbi:MAG: molybdenum ABC transporter ATP-binding protein [Halioglobus sp.]|nr:molybdenum ABC transporter ATP-binding protein [Halioglobus sp.]